MIWQPEFTDKTLSRKPGAVQNDKNCSARHLSKQGDLYRVENFSQLISLSEPGTSPGQEKKRGCGHPVY
ncbi:hypothetical protein [Escherichia coli]|uniref:hypothetical protein n=1 Tax=Escherichia coli TaxID=562 RepID=UPI001BFCA5B7|nr:hypothetical protein [Escherichia coli]